MELVLANNDSILEDPVYHTAGDLNIAAIDIRPSSRAPMPFSLPEPHNLLSAATLPLCRFFRWGSCRVLPPQQATLGVMLCYVMCGVTRIAS